MKAPDIELNIASDSLNLDNLIAIMGGLPAAGKKSAPKKEKQAAAGMALPPDLLMHGRMDIKQTIYKQLSLHNLSLRYSIKKGILSVQDLTAETAGGKVVSNAEIDLTTPSPSYKGRISAQDLQADKLRAGLFPKAADRINGELESAVSFSGSGTAWSEVSKTLAAEGNYALSRAMIRNTEITKAAADFLGLPQINDLALEDMSGTVHLDKGKAVIDTGLTGKDIQVKTQGSIGLDGSLNLPLTIRLSKALSEKIKNRSITKFLEDAEGGAVLHLKLAGTAQNPSLSLDTAGTRKQLEKTIQQKMLKEIDKALPQDQADDSGKKPVLDLLKGILGK